MNTRRIISLIPTVIIVSLAWSYHQYLQYVIGALLIFVAVVIFAKLFRAVARMTHSASFREIDQMDGIEFEKYIAQMLRTNGYSHVKLTDKFDYGIDILARKNGVRWGIQVKRNRGQVKVDAVRQAVTGLKMYDCDKAMVITNSYFGRYARTLARVNDCVLIDRSRLYKLLR